jgi:hypothetical protein
MHICPTGIKINCDNETFLECSVPYGSIKEAFSYDYPSAQSVFSVRNEISLSPLTATSRFLAIIANPSHLPELSAPSVSESVWIQVPREYLCDMFRMGNSWSTVSVDLDGFSVTNGNVKFSYGQRLANSKAYATNIAPDMAMVVAEFLGALGSPMVEVAVGEDIAFGIRNYVDQGSYFTGPRYVLWIPHHKII